jgi:biopolymer transport protein ExbD
MARRKNLAGEGGGGTDLSVIITPMLDMAFQLLAFFIMTYHPPAREAIVDDTLLPAAQQKGKGAPSTSEQKAEKEKKKDPEPKFSLQVFLRAVPKVKGPKGQWMSPPGEVLAPGQPKEIMLFKPGQLEPSFRVQMATRGPTPADPPADFEAKLNMLRDELKKSRDNPAEKDLPLDISADRALKYLYVARLRDMVGSAPFVGPLAFKRIGFNEPP